MTNFESVVLALALAYALIFQALNYLVVAILGLLGAWRYNA